MPWLTPESIPEDDDCRPLSIPADSVWLALISGALTELTKPYNWQQFGALTVAETIAKMQSIIDNYYDAPCAMCITPGGYRVVRISPSGHVEQLDPDGDWVNATDDYHIPPPEAREDGTPDDQICLAAKNAVNVLQQLYESLSESWASELSTDEAVLALIGVLVAEVGFAFAPIVWAIMAFLLPIFVLVYEALAYLTADLWDEAFTKQITCFLVDCASNDAGVVTFDWDCFNAHLNSLADSFGLSEVQLRLYIQIGYILLFIGGVDGLNLAARTTDITNDDCTFCDPCFVFDFRVSDEGFVADTYGTWVAGEGWQVNPTPSAIMIGLSTSPFPLNMQSVTVEFSNGGGDGVMALYWYDGSYHAITSGELFAAGDHSVEMLTGATGVVPNLFFNCNADNGSTCYIRKLTVCPAE